jgi:hypothetical protein
MYVVIANALVESGMKDRAAQLVSRFIDVTSKISKASDKATLLAALAEIEYKLGMKYQAQELANEAINLAVLGYGWSKLEEMHISLYDSSLSSSVIVHSAKALARTESFEKAIEVAGSFRSPLMDDSSTLFVVYVIHENMETFVILVKKLVEAGIIDPCFRSC